MRTTSVPALHFDLLEGSPGAAAPLRRPPHTTVTLPGQPGSDGNLLASYLTTTASHRHLRRLRFLHPPESLSPVQLVRTLPLTISLLVRCTGLLLRSRARLFPRPRFLALYTVVQASISCPRGRRAPRHRPRLSPTSCQPPPSRRARKRSGPLARRDMPLLVPSVDDESKRYAASAPSMPQMPSRPALRQVTLAHQPNPFSPAAALPMHFYAFLRSPSQIAGVSVC